MEVWSFGHDPGDNLPIMSPFVSVEPCGETSRLVRLRTEKEIVVDLPPDSLAQLYSGGVARAGDLLPRTRLRKIARGSNPNRSDRRVIWHRATYRAPKGQEYMSRFMWEQRYGPISEGHEVHHKNHDPTDDRHSNLELPEKRAHRVSHARGSANNRFINSPDALLLEVWEGAEEAFGRGPLSVSRWNRYIQANGFRGRVPLANYSRGIQGMSWEAFTAKMGGLKGEANDYVVSLQPVDLPRPVPLYAVATRHGTLAVRGPESKSGALHSLVLGRPRP